MKAHTHNDICNLHLNERELIKNNRPYLDLDLRFFTRIVSSVLIRMLSMSLAFVAKHLQRKPMAMRGYPHDCDR